MMQSAVGLGMLKCLKRGAYDKARYTIMPARFTCCRLCVYTV